MGANDGARMPTQVGHVRAALLDNYQDRIYKEDLRGYLGHDWEQRVLSRALAAEAIRIVTCCDYESAGASVTDGERDQGIDAVAVGDASPDIWLVQAKWSDRGTARFPRDEALAMADGVRLLDKREFEPFNDRFTPFISALDTAMGDARVRVHLVIAVMGDAVLPEPARDVLARLKDDANVHGPMIEWTVLGSAHFHERLRRDLAPPRVDVQVTLNQWLRKTHPFEAWYGPASAGDIARWHAEHGDALYEQNVRKSLGLTQINSGIKDTLLTEPDNFWYFNNGITVLCEEIEPHYPARRRSEEPVQLTLKGVSVVNGAQTVTSAHQAAEANPESAEDADISVRVIALGTERETYAARITETTNTQNDVSARDFVALDRVHERIREDFLLSGLGKTYVYKRGERTPAPEAGCSIEEAAIALACAYPRPNLAMQAATSVDLLWDRDSRGAYPRLFGEQPSALRIWRSVELARRVRATLDEYKRHNLHGRAAEIARRGELLITHLVFRFADPDVFDDPDADWKRVLDGVPDLTVRAITWLVHHLDVEFGKNAFLSSTFSNEDRCKRLTELVLADLHGNDLPPELPDDYRPPKRGSRRPRRPNAVPTLVNARRITDGTPLTFHTRSEPERQAIGEWLAADPRRGQATWVNDRVNCLLWSIDEHRYSASALVQRIWELAGYEDAPVAVQGPRRWCLDTGESLWELALALDADDADAEP